MRAAGRATRDDVNVACAAVIPSTNTEGASLG